METEVKQGNQKSRSSSVIIDVKTDAGIEMANPTTNKDYYKNENCQSSQSFQGRDKVGVEKIINGGAKSTSGESSKGDELKMCRICHLGYLESNNSEILIQLGCGCKSELGASHLSCAQTWFKLKGNSNIRVSKMELKMLGDDELLCEICGKIAVNVSGVEETYTNANNANNASVILVVEWDEMGRYRSSTATATGSSITQDRERFRRNCRNVVLACLVLAFIVPWFFRINLF